MTLTRAAVCAAVLLTLTNADAQCPPAFSAPPTYAYGSLLELADFNNDGHLDALTGDDREHSIRLNLGTRGVFRRGARIPLGDAPRGSTTGDFNRDGKLDAVVAGDLNNEIHLFPGRGDGTFDERRRVAGSDNPYALHAADLDADGKLDLVVANLGGTIDVWWGRGDGTFESAPLSFTPAFFPFLVTTADMNEDGRPDIIAGHENGAITITTMNAGRAHGATQRVDMEGFVYGMKVRDFDGDGNLDVIAADPIEFRVSIFKGNGDGTVEIEPLDVQAGSFTEGVDFGDFNEDGRLDVVVGQSVEHSLAILYRRADGSLGEPVLHPAGDTVYDVRVADLDHDGDDDLAASNIHGFSVLLNQFGNGEFPQAESHSVGGKLGPYDTITADLNADGVPDFITANALHSTLSVFLGNRNGTLQEAAIHFAAEGPYRVIAVDLNGDAHLDLVSANLFADNISVLHGRGDGTFHEQTRYETSASPSALSSGDIDRDGDADLLVSSIEEGTINVFLNAGNGTFTRGIDVDGRAPGQTVLVDLNGDAKLDLAVVDREDPVEPVLGNLTIHTGNGDGTFSSPVDHQVGVRPIDLAAHDFNADGRLDFAVASFDDNAVTILLSTSAGYRPAAQLLASGPIPHFTIADFNLDGHADIAAPTGGAVFIFHGRGAGQFAEPVAYRAGITPFSIAAADLNRDSRPDLAVANVNSSDLTILRNITSCRQRAVRK